MSLLKSSPLFNSLITFSKNGIQVASYSDIRIAVTTRYKEIYGEDIDVSTSTADGQYIEMLCLIINNMFMSFKSFYGNLDVRTAQGKFLDMLAALTNVTREPARNSTASLIVTYTGQSDLIIGPTSLASDTMIQFLDKGGKTWTFKPSVDTTFTPNIAQTIVVTCDEEGPVRADANWIDTIVDASLLMTVTQNEAAEIGTYKETDSQLRSRRIQTLGASGITVLQSLVGALRSIEGIVDVKVYNNDATAEDTFTAKDGTELNLHSVYVVIRRLQNATIADSLIGTTLYEKMTPGIHFMKALKNSAGDDDDDPSYPAKYGTGHNYQYVQSYQGQPLDTRIRQYARWKDATPIHPTIVILLEKQVVNYDVHSDSFSSAYSSATSEIVANNVIEYMNDLSLSDDAKPAFIRMQAQMSDPLFKGLPTFIVQSVTVNGVTTDYLNPDTFYNYSSFTVLDGDTAEGQEGGLSDGEVQITIQ